ncbi:alpha/beta fold hydrolase [Nocardia tengchongensis]|uniref:alpha/beta fold hydrolase n=1 Tax=Nocardia tengchongensis TaxID=2055889 RepID=UPI00367EAC81
MPESVAGCGDRFVRLPNGFRICYRLDGRPGDPPVLLLGGLGEDLTTWSQPFVTALASRGFSVIRMDNRDSGRSTFDSAPAPGTLRLLCGRPRADAYTLTDNAADGAQLLECLGVDRAHLVGRSMGGMIAQTLAAQFPARTASLTSIYSTTGGPGVGGPSLKTMSMLAAAPPRTRLQAVQAHLRLTGHLAGLAYPMDEAAETAHAVSTWNRIAGDADAGMRRQMQAIRASGDRTGELRTITAPTLVINGDRDPLVHPSGGAATAAAIAGSHHVVIPGMGHHLPDSLTDRIVELICAHLTPASDHPHRRNSR